MTAEIDAVEPKRVDGSVFAEPLGYAGAATVLAAAALFLVNSGSESKTSTAVTIGLAAAGLFGAGALLGRTVEDRAARMRSVFWFLSAVVVFELMVLLTIDENGGSGAIVTSALATAAYSGVLWWLSRRSLQQIVLFGAVLLTLLAAVFPDLGLFFLGSPDFTPLMAVALVIGVGWFVLGWRGLVEPSRTAMVLGALTASFSPVFLSATGDVTAMGVIIMIVGTALIVVGQLVGDRAVSGIGIVGALQGTTILVTDLVKASDTGAIAALVLGLVMVAGAILLLQPRWEPGSGSIALPVPAT
ncbi:MAG: hypothetical protein H0W82_06430, partial [Actinobacteria bacterium]|nr:hypothetical protein [Actinomycetota bacterium]